ncbi:MAG: enoyl-CoA hydratase/isomerase family protein, partial [Actinobacteria bacterium]|nr:enoyl-CoA hydratase/isomerase family protein [Actinomycetota bacterium]
MNTITMRMLDTLSSRLLEADTDPDVRVIVLTGAGRAWCAGLDVAETAAGGGLGSADGGVGAMAGEFDLRNAPPVVLHKIDTPVIAALNGGAAG